ncbi:MAG: hypothetical protein NVV82_26680 [Sporocytophaga sp.]|nr:hypothetical protein [Sporocytophaga sp.]
MDNFEWLSSIEPIGAQDWHSDLVVRYTDINNYEFYKKGKIYYKGRINTADIKGIEYAYNYNHDSDITWKQLLNSLKRFEDIRINQSNYSGLVNHIKNDYDEPKTVLKFGPIYITTQGQHRLALAKFLNLDVEVNIIEYEFDYDLFFQFNKRKNFLNVLFTNGLISKEDMDVNLMNRGNYLSVKLFGEYIPIDSSMFNAFLEAYYKLNTNKFNLFLDKLLFLKGDLKNFKIDKQADVNYFKPYLRRLKSERCII